MATREKSGEGIREAPVHCSSSKKAKVPYSTKYRSSTHRPVMVGNGVDGDGREGKRGNKYWEPLTSADIGSYFIEHRDNFPVFILQILCIVITIIASLVNISLGTPPKELWISLLSAALGYSMPQPKLKLSKPLAKIVHI